MIFDCTGEAAKGKNKFWEKIKKKKEMPWPGLEPGTSCMATWNAWQWPIFHLSLH